MIDQIDLLNGPQATGSEVFDCVVVGGGPAGLTAGLYLRRFHRNVRVVDAGGGRARRVTRSNNVAGFPEGIGGAMLLQRMKRHLEQVGGKVTLDTVEDIQRGRDGLFAIGLTHDLLWSRNVIVCTGVKDRLPALPGIAAVESADLLRYCPVCDGYEHTRRRIGVIGNSIHGVREAAFLRNFSSDVCFIGTEDAAEDLSAAVREVGLRQVSGVAQRFAVDPDRQALVMTDDSLVHRFDVLYAALGVDPCTQLAAKLGAQLDGTNSLVTDAHCCTSVKNLYAAGAVVRALDQINVAVGHAAIAATAVHNTLGQRSLLRWERL